MAYLGRDVKDVHVTDSLTVNATAAPSFAEMVADVEVTVAADETVDA